MSKSVAFREEGNEHYRSAKEVTAPVFKIVRLERAITYYNKAFQLACSEEENSAAAKNLGVAYRSLCGLVSEQEGFSRRVSYLFQEAVKFLSKALEFGISKPCIWRDSLIRILEETCSEALVLSSSLPFQERIAFSTNCLEHINTKHIRASVYLNQGTVTFHEGLRALDAGDAAKSLSLMKDCYFPVEQARSCGQLQESVLLEVRVLQEDVKINTWLCESLMARIKGEKLLEEVLKNEETLQMDLVWQVIDLFKESILLCRETNTEMEAIAFSRLGGVYAQVLKIKSKASENYKRSLELAMSMHPRIFTFEDWYQECNKVLEQYQKERVQQEDLEWQQERSTYFKELTEEIKELKSKNDALNDGEFLKYVYKTFPPKNPTFVLEEIPPETSDQFLSAIKKILRNSCCHYHPDKVIVKEHGKKWKVMCEEIVKLLTSRYEVRK